MADYDVIVKLTSRCNMHCEYCNVEENSGVDFPYEEIDEMINWLNESCENRICSILWHGGEPLILGHKYFKKIFDSQKRYPGRFQNLVSTNSLLLSDEIVDLFEEHEVGIKTSLDSIDLIHDKPRGYTCTRVIENLNYLKRRGFNNVYVRMTVSKENQSLIWDMYKFMCENYTFKWEFAPIIPAGLKKDEALKLIPDREIFVVAVKRIFNHWFDKHPFEIPIFMDILRYLMGMVYFPRVTQPRVNLGNDGLVYRCPLLIGNLQYSLGEYKKRNTVKQFKGFNCTWKKISKIECDKCRYNRICRLSSCAYVAVALDGIKGMEDYYCELWKPVYDEIYSVVGSSLRAENIYNYIQEEGGMENGNNIDVGTCELCQVSGS